MRTKEEIIDELMNYLNMAVAHGFFSRQEVRDIENLENEYFIQSENN